MSKADKILKMATAFEVLSIKKSANEDNSFYSTLSSYTNLSEALPEFIQGWRLIAENYKNNPRHTSVTDQKLYELFMKEAAIVESILPQLQAIDAEMNAINEFPTKDPSALDQ